MNTNHSDETRSIRSRDCATQPQPDLVKAAETEIIYRSPAANATAPSVPTSTFFTGVVKGQ
jgi:hypothetical protein